MGVREIIRNFFVDLKYGNRITSVVRILLGCMLVFTGCIKLLDPESFGGLIAGYDILPSVLVPYAAVWVPVFEVVIGMLLVIGYKIRASAMTAIFLMALFIVFVSVNLIRGRSFDCGCFGLSRIGLGIQEEISAWVVIRDLFFLAAFALVFSAERHLFSLENYREKMRLKNLEQSRYR